MERRTQIGVLVDSLDAVYQATLVRHLRDACERRKIRCVVMVGGGIRGCSLQADKRNHVYGLVGTLPVAGLIVVSGTMTREASAESIAEYCLQYQSIPCCSIGATIPGVPSVTVENAMGMRELTRHVLVGHNYTKLAYVGGPPNNIDAQERLLAFREELAAQGVALDERHVVYGDFMASSAAEALASLLQNGAGVPDVIIAANDAMALGLLDALSLEKNPDIRGIAVCGFDNVLESSYSSPPLTTVEQPLRLLAEASVEGLVRQLQGVAPPDEVQVSARPVYRYSCGCKPYSVQGASGRRVERQRGELGPQKELLHAALMRASDGAFRGVTGWESKLLEAFDCSVRSIPYNDFLQLVRNLLAQLSDMNLEEVWRFENILGVLRNECLPHWDKRSGEVAKANELLRAAHKLVGETQMRGLSRRLLRSERLGRQLNNIGASLLNCQGPEQFRAAVTAAKEELSISCLQIVAQGQEPAERWTLLYSNGVLPESSLASGDQHLSADDEAIAWSYGLTQGLVILPLFSANSELGFMVASLDTVNGTLYEGVRGYLSAALALRVHLPEPAMSANGKL